MMTQDYIGASNSAWSIIDFFIWYRSHYINNKIIKINMGLLTLEKTEI